jgi:hypothetical protein
VWDHGDITERGVCDHRDIAKKGVFNHGDILEREVCDHGDITERGGCDHGDITERGGCDHGDITERGVCDHGDITERGAWDHGDITERGVCDHGDITEKGVCAHGDISERGVCDHRDITKRGVCDHEDITGCCIGLFKLGSFNFVFLQDTFSYNISITVTGYFSRLQGLKTDNIQAEKHTQNSIQEGEREHKKGCALRTKRELTDMGKECAQHTPQGVDNSARINGHQTSHNNDRRVCVGTILSGYVSDTSVFVYCVWGRGSREPDPLRRLAQRRKRGAWTAREECVQYIPQGVGYISVTCL